MRFEFTIPGKPRAKARPRFGQGRTFTAAQTERAERQIGWLAKAAMKQAGITRPLMRPIKLDVIATFGIAKNKSKAVREVMHGQPHVYKPDGDNILKLVKDALNEIAYTDDSQVAISRVEKRWGTSGKTHVAIEEIKP